MSISRRNVSMLEVSQRLFMKHHQVRCKRPRNDLAKIVLPVNVDVLIREYLFGNDGRCTAEQMASLRSLLSCCRDCFFCLHDTVEMAEVNVSQLSSISQCFTGNWFDGSIVHTFSGFQFMDLFSSYLFALFYSLQVEARSPQVLSGCISCHPFGSLTFTRRRTSVDPNTEEKLLSAEDVFSFVQHIVFPDEYPLPSNITAQLPYSMVTRLHANRRVVLVSVLRATLALATRIWRWSRVSGCSGMHAFFHVAEGIKQEVSMCIDQWCPIKN